MSADHPHLPPGFVLGTSTAAYQIEGAIDVDGRGPSIWDTFCDEPGRILDASSGAEACDHYHRYAEDIALMSRLGVGGYRFSIAWPRIQPTGRGPALTAGLDFYDRLVDALLAAGIAPMATLYHWDLPQPLQDEGGWLRHDTAEAFAAYAAAVGERLADRVAHWVPINEPNVVTLMGHALGFHAPGATLMYDALPVGHHLNLAHGLAAQALRAAGASSVGTANNHAPMWPASDDPADHDAAALFDALWNGMYADPMLTGRYPDLVAPLLPSGHDDDLATIAQPLDFYGVNYYNPFGVRAGQGELPFDLAELTGYPTTDFGWPVVPEGLTETLVGLREQYPDLPPVLITENGCSYAAIADQARIDYLDAHLRAVGDAIAAGVDVRGYYLWSLMDNFEWSEGYTQRFGLVHVDYATQARTPRASFDWYAALIRAQR